MDPLSISASIVALLQLTETVNQYLDSVKRAPKDRRKVLLELSSVKGMLYILQHQADVAEGDDPWSSTLQSLGLPGGPVSQYKVTVESLASKLTSAEGWAKLGKAFTRPFEKEETYGILQALERHKALPKLV